MADTIVHSEQVIEPVPSSDNKVQIEPTVEEVHDEEPIAEAVAEPTAEPAPPAPTTTITKEFDCEYPSVEPTVYRTAEPLPFPNTLRDLISWTDAFVERIAGMTEAEQKVHSSYEFVRSSVLNLTTEEYHRGHSTRGEDRAA